MGREGVWASHLVSRSTVKRRLSHFYRAVLSGFCLPSGHLSGFFIHTCPTLRPSPGYTRTPQPMWVSKCRLLRGARFIMAWQYLLTLDPCPKRAGTGDPLILYSNRVSPLWVFTVTITLRCLQETNTGYFPCFCCYFHFGGQTGS